MICFSYPFPVVFFEKIVTVVLEYLSFLIVCYVRERNVCSGFLRIFRDCYQMRFVGVLLHSLNGCQGLSYSATNERRSI